MAKRFKKTASQPKVEVEAKTETAEFNAQDFNPLPSESSNAAKSSAEIFSEIGAQLRQRREMLSLTYDEIERHTRVRAAFQKALEEGALDDLPSLVQTRGILANYAGFLDLDADAILLRFADGLQERHRERQLEKPKRRRGTMTVNSSLPPLRTFIASDLLFGGGIAILLLLFAIWGITRVVAVGATTRPQATSLSISQILAETPIDAQGVTVIPADTSLAATALAVPATITLPAPTLGANIKVQVNLVAVESTYLRVNVDGKLQFEGRAEAGSAYPYEAENQIEVVVGNASAIKVTYNGRSLGLMGSFGEVVDRIYGAASVGTPTSTKPPTATPSPDVTPTPSETPTVTPSATGTPNSGG